MVEVLLLVFMAMNFDAAIVNLIISNIDVIIRNKK